jgi:RNA polymerase sigma-70 factor (ECF subfamily)
MSPRCEDLTPGADIFQAERPRLLGLAYRLLGGRADAEDVVQEAWLRWSGADWAAIVNPEGWLTTVTTRLALDRLREVGRRREAYVGPWLPEPVSTERSPEEHAELAESLTLGFLVMLDGLAPVERAVLLLGDVFGEPYSIIAPAVGKSEAACRQVATRARRKLRAGAAAATTGDLHLESTPASADLLAELMRALVTGDEDRAVRLLDPDVVLVSDAGAARRAARRPVVGPHRVTRLLVNLAKRNGRLPTRFATYNAGPALVMEAPDGPIVVAGEATGGRVSRIWILANLDKIASLDEPVDLR